MRKILLGLVATAALATPLVATTAAHADTTPPTTCTSVAAQPAHSYNEFKYVPVKNGTGPTRWSVTSGLTSFDKVSYVQDGTKTRTVDVPAVAGVDCPPIVPDGPQSATLPEHFAGEGTCSVVVPYTLGVETRLYGVPGHPETDPITADVAVTNADVAQFWVGYTAVGDNLITNPTAGQWHIDFNAPVCTA